MLSLFSGPSLLDSRFFCLWRLWLCVWLRLSTKGSLCILMGFIFFCSKSYCPYCVKVKDLLKKLGAKFIAVELDKESNNPQSSSHNHFIFYDLKIKGFSAFTSRNFVIVFFSSILCFIQLYACSRVFFFFLVNMLNKNVVLSLCRETKHCK